MVAALKGILVLKSLFLKASDAFLTNACAIPIVSLLPFSKAPIQDSATILYNSNLDSGEPVSNTCLTASFNLAIWEATTPPMSL